MLQSFTSCKKGKQQIQWIENTDIQSNIIKFLGKALSRCIKKQFLTLIYRSKKTACFSESASTFGHMSIRVLDAMRFSFMPGWCEHTHTYTEESKKKTIVPHTVQGREQRLHIALLQQSLKSDYSHLDTMINSSHHTWNHSDRTQALIKDLFMSICTVYEYVCWCIYESEKQQETAKS